jgi:hypothetical protein
LGSLGVLYIWDLCVKIAHRHATDGGVFGQSYVVVEAARKSSKERHLALCQVSQVLSVTGPPRNCATVAILTPTRVWLRGRLRDQNWCNVSAVYRTSGAIEIAFDLVTHIELLRFVEALRAAMVSDLGLTVEVRFESVENGPVAAGHLSSTAGLRNSTILPKGWRESLDFDIDLAANQGHMRINGVAHINVCRQALGTLVDYHGLNDGQRDMYAGVLNAAIGKALKSACKHAAQRDAKTIVCE